MRKPVTMQRRHFELIANTLRCANVNDAAKWQMAREFAYALSNTNPQFNRARFLEAVGLDEQAKRIA